MLTTVEAYDDSALVALIASATELGADLKAGLFTNNITPGKQNVVGDFTEPTYAGYARQSVVLGAPFRDPLLGISSLAAPLTWQEGGAITPVTVLGVFYTFGAGNVLLGAERFLNPQNLVDALSAFQTILQYVQSAPAASYTQVVA